MATNDSIPVSEKAKSPSPNIQRGIDQSWGRENTTDPKAALAQKHTNNPVKVGGQKK